MLFYMNMNFNYSLWNYTYYYDLYEGDFKFKARETYKTGLIVLCHRSGGLATSSIHYCTLFDFKYWKYILVIKTTKFPDEYFLYKIKSETNYFLTAISLTVVVEKGKHQKNRLGLYTLYTARYLHPLSSWFYARGRVVRIDGKHWAKLNHILYNQKSQLYVVPFSIIFHTWNKIQTSNNF